MTKFVVDSGAVLHLAGIRINVGWASTYDAEYVALTPLQADAFITMDADLAQSVKGIVATASIDALR
jgi:predicted nucleic acid-binding protein